MAHLAEEPIQDLRERHKLFPRATRGQALRLPPRSCRRRAPLPDPAYRALQRDRKRAHNIWQDGCRRERNRGAEKRQKANNKPENQESRAFLVNTQSSCPLFPGPCSSGLSSVHAWSPQEGLSKGLFGNRGGVKSGREYEWVPRRPYPVAVITRSNCLPPLAQEAGHQSIITEETVWVKELAPLCSMAPHKSSYRVTYFVYIAGTRGCLYAMKQISTFSAGIFAVPRSAGLGDTELFFSAPLRAAAEERLNTASAPECPLLSAFVSLRLLHQGCGESPDVLAEAAALDMPLIEKFHDSPPERGVRTGAQSGSPSKG